MDWMCMYVCARTKRSELVNLTVGALNANNYKTVKATDDFKLNAHVSSDISYSIP